MTVLDAARLRLQIAAGPWPPASKSGVPVYTPRLQKLVDAGLVAACRWCGCATPSTSSSDWTTCDSCRDADAYGRRWPLVAALDGPYRRQVTPALRQRTLARRHLLLGALPGYGDLPGAQPTRPVARWSHLDLPVPEATLAPNGDGPLISTVTVRTTTEASRYGPVSRFHVEALPGQTWPTWRTVIAAAIAGARAEVEAGEVVPPPAGWPGCAWCGIASAPRQDWQMVDGRPWCARAADCPAPIIGSPVRDRAQCVAAILDEAYDPGVVEQARRSGRLPAVRFQDQPDDERAEGGWTGPYGWLSDEDVEGLRALLDEIAAPNDERVAEALRQGRAATEVARRAQEARAAELAELEQRAVEAAEARAAELIAEQTPAEREPTLAEHVAGEIAKAIEPSIRPRLGSELLRRNAERRRAAERAPHR